MEKSTKIQYSMLYI